jgi:hypothetical protein
MNFETLEHPRDNSPMVYADVLARSPEPLEINHWLQILERFGGARDRTAQEFLLGAKEELAQRKP